MARLKPASQFHWRDRRVLVTGATGMIGAWLVKTLLARKASVTAFVLDADPMSEFFRSGDSSRVSVVNGALQDFAAIERAINAHEIDTVFHLGAQTIVGAAQRNPWGTFESNVRGTYNLLEACRLHSGLVKRVVVASSDKSYGEAARLPYVEETPLNAGNPYDVSKACTDIIARSYAKSYGLPVAVARSGNTYGGGDLNWSRVIPGTIRSLLAGERPVIRSDGKFVRDYVYVKDAAAAYVRLAERLSDDRVRGGAFNFGTQRPATVLDVVRAISRLMGQEHVKPDIRDEAAGEIRSQYLSSAKARRVLGWKPEYNLEAGLRETIAWYRGLLKP